MQQGFLRFIDFFYPIFKRLMPLDTYRYAACGGMNTALALLVYFVCYHYIFDKTLVHLGYLVFKPHMAALFVSGIGSFFVGFILNKFIVFTTSILRGRIQLFRYLLSFLFNITLNYFMLKLLVEYLGQDVFYSQLLTTCIVITISYLTQKHFTFKVK